jgi:hypothetical protein
MTTGYINLELRIIRTYRQAGLCSLCLLRVLPPGRDRFSVKNSRNHNPGSYREHKEIIQENVKTNTEVVIAITF